MLIYFINSIYSTKISIYSRIILPIIILCITIEPISQPQSLFSMPQEVNNISELETEQSPKVLTDANKKTFSKAVNPSGTDSKTPTGTSSSNIDIDKYPIHSPLEEYEYNSHTNNNYFFWDSITFNINFNSIYEELVHITSICMNFIYLHYLEVVLSVVILIVLGIIYTLAMIYQNSSKYTNVPSKVYNNKLFVKSNNFYTKKNKIFSYLVIINIFTLVINILFLIHRVFMLIRVQDFFDKSTGAAIDKFLFNATRGIDLPEQLLTNVNKEALLSFLSSTRETFAFLIEKDPQVVLIIILIVIVTVYSTIISFFSNQNAYLTIFVHAIFICLSMLVLTRDVTLLQSFTNFDCYQELFDLTSRVIDNLFYYSKVTVLLIGISLIFGVFFKKYKFYPFIYFLLVYSNIVYIIKIGIAIYILHYTTNYTKDIEMLLSYIVQ